jgi:hypothetical protein
MPTARPVGASAGLYDPAVGRLAKVKKKRKAQKKKREAVEKARAKDKAKRK